MSPPTRRRFLRAGGLALGVGLAGCATRALDGDRDDATPSPTASEPTYARRVDAPESTTVRNHDGEPVVRSSAHTPEANLFEESASWAYEAWLVADQRDREALDVSRATAGADAARQFLADTDLSTATVLVHQYTVPECETHRLDRLEWRTDAQCGDRACVDIQLRYEDTTWDGDCQASETDELDGGPPYPEGTYASEATLVRIPSEIQSYGSFGYQV
ncbi:hypothetical protein [Halorarius litoreus]|uniref:hypothetical protein n=1 Tax=Halorarius litoreus TaxID=2962676 RepID=UPI0020CC6C8A|nr:hypothetical protein [Halorarius litoreus]